MKKVAANQFRYQVALFAFIRTVFNTAFRMIYPFLPIFSRALGVDIATLSLAVTSRQAIGIFGPFLSIIFESRGRKLGILISLSLFTVGVILVVIWPIFPVFFLALILTTLGKYMFDPIMQGYIGEEVPYPKRGLAIAVTELGWSIAFIVGIPLMGFLISRYGFISPFALLAILALLSIFIVGKILQPTTKTDNEWSKIIENFRRVLRYTPALTALLIGISISVANEIINLVFGLWLEDSFGLQIMALGGAAAAIGLAELGGESLMGLFTDRLGKSRSIGLGIIANAITAGILPILGRSPSGAVIALFLFYITFEFTLVALIPLMTEIMPSARVTFMAFNVAGLSIGRGLGALIASPIYLYGIGFSAAAAIVVNALAFIALLRLNQMDIFAK